MISVKNVTKSFRKMSLTTQTIPVISDVSFTIDDGDVFGLIGESGSGKSTIANLILRLIKPTSGDITFNEKSIFIKDKEWQKELSESIQMVFQHPDMSLNPVMTVEDNLLEILKIQKKYNSYEDSIDKIIQNFDMLKLSKSLLSRYPHEISGGEAQRIIIARALLADVKLLVLDEPTSMLDASIQQEIMNLLFDLKEVRHLSLLLITHDIEIAKYCTNKLGVIKEGKIVEVGKTDNIFNQPSHSYTKELVSNFNALSIPNRY
ncbi:ABC transporter ATP-binding protein [Vagococcus carniphilus]|uniref:ABC transporter ATP-binding protein n=1 Tax=Vagococcus carniphilus TaxID=218144 RepID=UPI003B59D0F5